MIVELAVDHLLRGLHDGLADGLVEAAQRHVGLCRRALHDAQGADHGQGLPLPADLEIAQGPLGLGAPIAAGINLNGSERVGFGTGLGHGRSFGDYFFTFVVQDIRSHFVEYFCKRNKIFFI